MIPVQNLCGLSSFAFTTTANNYFLYSIDCIHLFSPIPIFLRLRYPSAKLFQPLIISQKRHNEPLLVEHSLISEDAPSRVQPSLSTPIRPPPSVLTWTFVADSSPQGRAPSLVSRTQTCTRIVGGTHIPRVDRGLSFTDLQIRPSYAERQGRHCIVPEWQ